MKFLPKALLGLLAAATFLTVSAPSAEARHFYHGYRYHSHYYYRGPSVVYGSPVYYYDTPGYYSYAPRYYDDGPAFSFAFGGRPYRSYGYYHSRHHHR